uniref:Uncharacterized protein n=1 Tax=Arundo donax TaxID=35708 RepID=A0A0A8XRS8_ARUDO
MLEATRRRRLWKRRVAAASR